MTTNVFAQRRRFLTGVVLAVLLATACDSAKAPTDPSALPAPIQHRVSGIVTDATDMAPIANATVVLRHYQGHLTTQTGADGAYTFSFETSAPYRPPLGAGSGEFLGLLIVRDGEYWGDTRRGHWTTLQLLPWGSRDVVRTVRLRSVRTLAAGQSMGLSVESDSSLLWNQEWDPWEGLSSDTLQEEFRVAVQTDGVLTVEVRSETGGDVGIVTCHYGGCPPWGVKASTVSIPVLAGRTPFYFSVQIPRARAPQRYEILTSLQ
jgi:hypothetical protein